jgi:hypothetical protein
VLDLVRVEKRRPATGPSVLAREHDRAGDLLHREITDVPCDGQVTKYGWKFEQSDKSLVTEVTRRIGHIECLSLAKNREDLR